MQDQGIKTHFLYPGAIFASTSHYTINTVLGSCVAVCLYDPVMRSGGMNHFMLPLWNGQGLAAPKYGNIAMEKLVEKMVSFGCHKRNLVAKVFGGGEVLQTKGNHQFNIGQKNINIAFEWLEKAKIIVKANSTGGELGRKIYFA